MSVNRRIGRNDSWLFAAAIGLVALAVIVAVKFPVVHHHTVNTPTVTVTTGGPDMTTPPSTTTPGVPNPTDPAFMPPHDNVPAVTTTPVVQTFPASTADVPIGEKMLGSYWTQGKLVSVNKSLSGQDQYGVAFNLPKGAELRAPADGVTSVQTQPSGVTMVFINPIPSMMQKWQGATVVFVGYLNVSVQNNQQVTAGKVVAVVANQATSLTSADGETVNGDVLVGYSMTNPSSPNLYVASLSSVGLAFPYINGGK
ncbi:MAG: hypothetical protein KGJ01_03650 [Patescibacteria group bacterium]|nr:hypothetical protein [Patescibacteria group bacterium]